MLITFDKKKPTLVNTDLCRYITDLNWKFVKLPKQKVKGQWTQKVYQADDSPRYEATATWIHADGTLLGEPD